MAQGTHIEVRGWIVRHYDLMMDLLLLGRYQSFIEEAIGRISIQRGEVILDLGADMGRNICLPVLWLGTGMTEVLGPTRRIVGVDISQEMLQQAW